VVAIEAYSLCTEPKARPTSCCDFLSEPTRRWRDQASDCRVGSRPGSPRARYAPRLLSAKKRTFLARKDPRDYAL
jgi:hypothetical protein